MADTSGMNASLDNIERLLSDPKFRREQQKLQKPAEKTLAEAFADELHALRDRNAVTFRGSDQGWS